MQLAFGIFVLFVALNSINVHSTNVESEIDIISKSQAEPEWWENAVIYQIYPRSFKDSKGTGIGDIKGITENLDYLKELDIDAIWISPMFKSPMKDFGYDVSNFYHIDPLFGTMEDFEDLIKKGKENNLKIFVDFIPNHSSDQCEWFKKSVEKQDGFGDFYVWHDGKRDSDGNLIRGPDGKPLVPNNWRSHFYGSAWEWNEKREQYYLHQFEIGQPDFNYSNEKVFEEMRKVMEFWLEKGVGGLRVDAVNYIFEDKYFRDDPLSFETNDPNEYAYVKHIHSKDLPESLDVLYRFCEVADEYHKQHGGLKPILLTEAITNSTEYIKYFGSEDGKKKGSQIPFNFVLLFDLNTTSTATDFKRVIDGRISIVNKRKGINWVTNNHDVPRGDIRLGAEKTDALLTLGMTLPGVAITYQGEEIGMIDYTGITFNETVDPQGANVGESGPWKKLSRDPSRTPFQWNSNKFAGFMPANATAKPWLPIHPNYVHVNVEDQKKATHSTLKYYKQLVQLRKNSAFKYGSYESKVLNGRVFGYVRDHIATNTTFAVLMNLGECEERINATELTTKLGKISEVVLAGSESHLLESQLLETDNILLRKYDTVIIKSHHFVHRLQCKTHECLSHLINNSK